MNTIREWSRADIEYFLSFKVSREWKGLASVCIMLGHYLPYPFNQLFIGYAWVGIFFMYSSYGLQHSLETKKKYLEGFWIKK